MQVSVKHLAKSAVATVNLLKACALALCAIATGLIAVWLMKGGHWFLMIVGLWVLWITLQFAYKACVTYLQVRPERSPAERQQYLDSRLLYNPEKRNTERRRQKQRFEQQ